MNVSLRKAKDEDAPFIRNVIQDGLATICRNFKVPDLEDVKNEFVRVSECYIITKGHRDVGFARWYKNEQTLHLQNLEVAANYRSISIGKSTLKILFEQSERLQLPWVTECYSENIGAVRFFQYNGFKVYSESSGIIYFIRPLIDSL